MVSLMQDILKAIVNGGGNPYLIGGCVRDSILGLNSKDIDVEVFNMEVEELINILSAFGKVDCVGKSFGVIKLTVGKDDYDFSLPRRENKIGVGHKDFEVIVDNNMSIEEAASRRDFTFNAISKDVEGNIVDPFGGTKDLEGGILRHTSDQFAEDPLRVLRGFQFCGRFNLIADISTIKICRELKNDFSSISKERIWTEFEKWAMKSQNHKLGLDFLVMSHWIDCFPELKNILGVPQQLEFHPEGCVFTHTAYVVNAMNDICARENISGDRKLILILAALCHDLGKADTTIFRKGRISAPNHDVVGGPLTKSFLESIKCPNFIIDRVVPLVENHMCHLNGVTNKMVNKLSVKLGKASIEDLVLLIEADHSGRPPKEKKCPEAAIALLNVARKLGVNLKKPERIVNGKDLINVVPQGQDLGNLLRWLYSKQLEEKFLSLQGGLKLVSHHHLYKKYYKSLT